MILISRARYQLRFRDYMYFWLTRIQTECFELLDLRIGKSNLCSDVQLRIHHWRNICTHSGANWLSCFRLAFVILRFRRIRESLAKFDVFRLFSTVVTIVML